MGNKAMCCKNEMQSQKEIDYLDFIHTLKRELLNFRAQRWHDKISTAIQTAPPFNHGQMITEFKRKEMDKFQIIKEHLHLKGNILSLIFYEYANRKFNEPYTRSQIQCFSSIASDERISRHFQSLAHSFINSSEQSQYICSTKEISRVVDDIQKFSQFFSHVIQAFYQLTNVNREDLILMSINLLFSYATFYENIKCIYERRLIHLSKQYREGLKILQQQPIEKFDIKEKFLTDFSPAVEILRTVASKKTPNQKIGTLEETVNAINGQLVSKNYDADQLLNIVLLVISQANIADLVIDIKMAEHFILNQFLNEQEGYVLITFMAATQFVIDQGQ